MNEEELKSSLERQSELLNSNGVICHSFWEGKGSEVFKGLYVNYQTKESLTKLVELYFEVIFIETYKEFEDGDSLLILARRKTNSG